MRSLWLASAATLFIAGAATAQTAGPAPTGAPNAATATTPGHSPGSMGTATSGSGGTTTPGAAASNSGAPVANGSGAPTPPTVTTPGMSSGKAMTPGSSTSSDTTTSTATPMTSPMAAPTMHHHYYHHTGMGMGMMAMPASATTTTYLTIAKHSIMHHNKTMAEEALSRAETNLLDRSVPQGGITADSDPGVTSIEGARKAVMAGDMKTAASDTDMAMQQSGGGMSGGTMAPMASPSAMSAPTPMMRKPMKHSIYGASDSGMAPAPGDTSDSGVGGNGAMTPGHSTEKPASSP